MATQPSLRIGDRERDAVVAELQEHYAHGRLTLGEFQQRLDAVFVAKTQADLGRITSDLPHIRPWGPLPSSSAQMSSWQPYPAGPGQATAAAWAASAWTGPGSRHDWQGGSRPGGPRGGFGLLLALMSVLASWLLVYDVILTGLRLPLPGRLGLLIAIYTLIRALLRRIFRRRR